MLYVDIPTRSDLDSLLKYSKPGCVSIYLQTTPLTQAAQADRIMLKNLMKRAVKQLEEQNADRTVIGPVESAIDDLIQDDQFWAHQANSLAIFATANRLRCYRLPNRLENLVEVSNRFHVKLLLRAITFPHNAFLLVLAESGVRLLEINSDQAHDVQVPGMPKHPSKAEGRFGLNDRARAAKFARTIDAAIRPILAGHQRTLILAASEPLASAFSSLCSYAHFADNVIRSHTDTMTDTELTAAAHEVLKTLYSADIHSLAQRFGALKGDALATSDLSTAARAATYGAIETLIVDLSAVVPGTVNSDGQIKFADHADASSYGVTDEIMRRAMASGARVISGRAEDVPGGAALAAILRYPIEAETLLEKHGER